jgi:outer membrane protein assembly factor BamD (BamD/ComL family)
MVAAGIALLLAFFPGGQAGASPAEIEEQVSAEVFGHAERLAVEGQPGSAIAKFRIVVNRYRKTSLASKAQYRIAQLYDRNRENEKAFEHYQVLIDRFPESGLFLEALQAQLRIANRVLDAYALRERKGEDRAPDPLKDPEKASRMLRIILENGRYTAWAPETHYRLAVALEKEGWPRSAAREHELILERYPKEHVSDDAAFQIAYINYKLCKAKNDEAGYRTRAQMAFQYLLQVYPDSEKTPLARQLLAELDSLEFNALVVAGEYYEKSGDAHAALVYYGDAENRFPSDFTKLEWLPGRVKDLRERHPEISEKRRAAAPKQVEGREAGTGDPEAPAPGE